VRQCDQIYLLERGEVKAQGLFEELTQANERFRAMAVGH
jgi:ATP-binding cassette, subfamily B, bacterial PglK